MEKKENQRPGFATPYTIRRRNNNTSYIHTGPRRPAEGILKLGGRGEADDCRRCERLREFRLPSDAVIGKILKIKALTLYFDHDRSGWAGIRIKFRIRVG
jgi:hypothetical protein